jgi:hypothetical protein
VLVLLLVRRVCRPSLLLRLALVLSWGIVALYLACIVWGLLHPEFPPPGLFLFVLHFHATMWPGSNEAREIAGVAIPFASLGLVLIAWRYGRTLPGEREMAAVTEPTPARQRKSGAAAPLSRALKWTAGIALVALASIAALPHVTAWLAAQRDSAHPHVEAAPVAEPPTAETRIYFSLGQAGRLDMGPEHLPPPDLSFPSEEQRTMTQEFYQQAVHQLLEQTLTADDSLTPTCRRGGLRACGLCCSSRGFRLTGSARGAPGSTQRRRLASRACLKPPNAVTVPGG